ncbi:transmembrane and death domain protein 1 [Gadus morhua]|uniref:transmembrane and death domain protein 1 n=1 Tax=Gadus morhua TaxID=8049 RepID=UPI0011B5F74D|nr:uncharacterized protein C12orf81-like [Gadus morhua]
MKDQRLLFFLFLLLIPCYGEETVAEDVGVHQIERLVELLTSTECRDLLTALSSPEENIFQHLRRLLPENNRLDPKPRARRDASDADAREAECRTALTHWLLRNGEQMYYDRLSRGLQHIGRSDIAAEVGKNINQDKSLSLKRYVEGYHKHASRLKTLPARSERSPQTRQDSRKTARKVRDLTWRDLDLVLVRAPVLLRGCPGVLDGAWPLLYGLLLGVGGALLLLHMAVRISARGRRSGPPRGSREQGDGASEGPIGARRTHVTQQRPTREC